MDIRQKRIISVRSLNHNRRMSNPCITNQLARPGRQLSTEELLLLDAYRHLPSVPHLAARRYILWRDIRLARAIYHRVFLNVALSQLRDQPPD